MARVRVRAIKVDDAGSLVDVMQQSGVWRYTISPFLGGIAMLSKREAVRILMSSPIYWLGDVYARLAAVKYYRASMLDACTKKLFLSTN